VLSDLVEVITSDARIAIAGAKNLLMENPRYTWGKYGVINWGPMLVRTVGRFALDGPDVPMRDVDFVIGNGCLIRCSALRDVGLFDETFFQLHEDVDWSLRARRCGYRTVYVDRAAILHKGSSSSQAGQRFTFRAAYFVGRNAIVFARRHAGFAQWARLFPLMIFGAFMRAAIGSAYAVFSSVREQAAFVRGMIAGFKKAPPRWESEQRDSGVWAPGDSWLDRLVRWLGG
jgi:GT2 family glycosyltransferase